MAATATRHPREGWGCLFVFAVFWCTITGVFAAFAIGVIVQQQYAKWRYRATTGSVLSGVVITQPGDSEAGPSYEPRLEYGYTVAGRRYTATRYAFGTGNLSQAAAQAIVAGHPVESEVTVYYDPAAPGRAVLSLALHPLHYFLLLFLQPFLLVGLGLIAALVIVPWHARRRRRLAAGPVRPPAVLPGWGRLQGDASHVRVSPGVAWQDHALGFVIGYGGACFVLVFVLVIPLVLGRFSPALVTIAFGSAIAVGLWTARYARRHAARKASLELDARQHELRLTGPAHALRLPFAQLAGWQLQTVMDPRAATSDDGPGPVALLVARTTSGDDVPIHVFGTGDDDLAGQVARAFAQFTHTPVLPPPAAPAAADVPPPEADSVPAPRGLLGALKTLGRSASADAATTAANRRAAEANRQRYPDLY